MMNKKTLFTSAGLGLAAVLFLAVNIVSNAGFKSARLDLTDNGLYTLSPGSRNILGALQEPINLRLYFSKKLVTSLPTISSYTVRVTELLEEYARASDGRIKLELIDPEPFTEAEDRAVGYGLQGVPIDNNNTLFYFGLAGNNSTDGEEVIPFFNPSRQEFLEYDITQLIYKLDNPKKKTVGIMSTLPIQGSASSPFLRQEEGGQAWMILEQIRQLFEVRTLETTLDKIPEDIDVLMLVHPKGLTDKTLYALDQFVLKGGRLLAFLDPYAETDTPPADANNPLAGMNAPRHSDLKKLLDVWGVELATDKVAGDLSLAKKVQIQKGSRGMVVNYPVWIDLKEGQFNQTDIITAKLDGISLASAGFLKKKEGAKIELEALLQTSAQGGLINTSGLGMFADPEQMVRDYKAEGQFVLAARLTGILNTAFPDGAPLDETADKEKDAAKPDEKAAAGLKVSAEPVNLILVADTDLLDDKFWVRVQNFLGNRVAIPQAANDQFVTNALDNLTGSNDLISVRNRGAFTRPFTRVDSIRQAAEQQFRDKEKQLLARLQSTEDKLRDLQNNKENGNSFILSPAQQQEINGFRDEKIKIRKDLRNVQHELQKDIENLESRVKFVNIGLVPLLVGFGGLALSYYRSRRRRALQAVTS